jgi:Ca-activated chloride channel family protein
MDFAVGQTMAYAGLLALAVGLAVLAAALRRLDSRREGRLQAFVESHLAPRLVRGYDARLRRPLGWLTLLAAAALGLALLQPQWGVDWEKRDESVRDVLLLIDVSESMRAADLTPSRMERARQTAAELLEEAPGERFGIIAFAGAAVLQCPLTLDHGYVRTVLDAVDTNSISREGTNVAAALREARRIFEEDAAANALRDGERPDNRSVVLLSDGEADGREAAAEARELAPYARVYVVGVGSEEGAVVEPPPWIETEAQGHVSRLYEDELRSIARAADGFYTRSTANLRGAERIAAMVRRQEGAEREAEYVPRPVNRYQWPLALAVACFALEGLWLSALPWRSRLRGRRAAGAKGQAAEEPQG